MRMRRIVLTNHTELPLVAPRENQNAFRTGLGETIQVETGQVKTSQVETSQVETGQLETSQVETGQDSS